MRRLGQGLLAAAACVVVACGGSEPESFPEGAVAVYAGGTLTVAEVDAALLKLEPTSRPPVAASDEWYETFVRELVFERLLRVEGESSDLRAGPGWAAREDDARRLAVQRVFVERLPPIFPPTEQEVRAEFGANREAQYRPASRLVRHIFLRVGAARSSVQAKAELEQIRQRVLADESFPLLARQLSESETRHRDGEMGWLRADQLGTLAPRIFSLPLRTPSEPIMTPQGGHLFYVEDAIEEREFEFAEVARLLADRMRRDRLAARFEEAVAQLPLSPEPRFVVDPDELRNLLSGGQDDMVVMQQGAFSVDLGGLRRLLRSRADAADPLAGALEILEQLEGRERVYQYALAEGWLNDPAVVERLEIEVDRAVMRFHRERKLAEYLAASRSEVEAYYEARRRRFTAPLRLALRELRIPIDPASANAVMRRLEEAVPVISRGDSTLEALQVELGGEVHDLGWATLAELAKAVPTVAAQAAALEGTGCLPPFRRQQTLHLIEVADRQEPLELSFTEVATEVERAYLEENRADVVRSVRDEVLASADFRIVVDDVASALRATALAN